MSLLIKARNVLYAIYIFYWLSFKAVMRGYYNGSVHLAQEFWAKSAWAFFRTKLYKCRHSEEVRRQKTIILSNHRSQADFWIHNIVTQYSCCFLARMAVGVVFFIFGIFANKTVWFFNRSGTIDHDKFNKWLSRKFQTSPRSSLLAYPEGHRMQGTVKVDKNALKSGMIRYAYREKIPVQLLMTFGNEFVFDQKKLHMGWNQKVYYSFSKAYFPEDYDDQKHFVTKVKDEFCNFFDHIWNQFSEDGQVSEVQPLRNSE